MGNIPCAGLLLNVKIVLNILFANYFILLLLELPMAILLGHIDMIFCLIFLVFFLEIIIFIANNIYQWQIQNFS